MSDVNVYVTTMDSELLRKIRKLRLNNAILSIALVGVATTGYKLLKLMRKVVLENAELKDSINKMSDRREDGE